MKNTKSELRRIKRRAWMALALVAVLAVLLIALLILLAETGP